MKVALPGAIIAKLLYGDVYVQDRNQIAVKIEAEPKGSLLNGSLQLRLMLKCSYGTARKVCYYTELSLRLSVQRASSVRCAVCCVLCA
jgi:hypothetical protein